MINSAGIILLNIPQYKGLLVQNTDGNWLFPTAVVNKNESHEDAIVRELLDKTSARVNLILNDSILDDKQINSAKYFFAFTCDNFIASNDREVVDVQWFALDELDKLENFPEKNLLPKINKAITSEKLKVFVSSSADKENSSIVEPKQIQGSKHLYSRVAPLALLSSNITFQGAPNTIDTYIIDEVIRFAKNEIGAKELHIPQSLSDLSRSVIALVPGLLYTHDKIFFHHPKGCNIGARKIDVYLEIMEYFGVEISHLDDYVVIDKDRIKPAELHLPFPSFTGTSTALIMASMINSPSFVDNISIEPEILIMIDFMRKLGMEVSFLSERKVKVAGCENPQIEPITFDIAEDRNVLVTKLMAALIMEKPYNFSSDNLLYLSPLVDILDRMKVDFVYTPHSIELKKNRLSDLKPVSIVANFYPGFCSDWQPLIAPVLCKIKGTSVIKDNVFESRYEYIAEIQKINPKFDYQIENDQLLIHGDTESNVKEESTVKSLDIRSGASNVIAAMGESKNIEITNTRQLFRGYENIVGDMEDLASGRVFYRL